MRVFSIVNLVLWVVLFGAWLPYAMTMGFGDSTTVDVMVILVVTAGLMIFLGAYRRAGHRPLLG